MACPRGLDFRHNRSLSTGEWNKINVCPGLGHLGRGGGGCEI